MRKKRYGKTVIPFNRWVLITGCDSGFGYSTAQQLTDLGFKVIAICLTEEGCQKLQSVIKDDSRLLTIQCNITKEEDIERLKVRLRDISNGKLWAIVNNAGIAIPGYFDFLEKEDFSKVMDVNFFGATHIIQLCLPLLKESRGRIVNISSTCGLIALPGNTPYNSSKFALRALNDTLRQELREWDVKVSLIIPGVMRTPINDKYLNIMEEKFRNAPIETKESYGEEYLKAIQLNIAKNMKRMAQDPQRTVNAIIHAVISKKPKTQYLIGLDAKLFQKLSTRSVWYRDRIFRLAGGRKPVAMVSKGTKVVEFFQLCNTNNFDVWEKFISIIWKQGAGFRPKLILEQEGDETGNGCTRWIPLFGKFGIRERIISTDFPHRIDYQVKNPSWTSFPVNVHRGYIEFIPLTPTATQVVWTIEVTPKPFMKGIVLGMIHFIIPKYLKVLAELCCQKDKKT